MADIFISYSRKDSPQAQILAERMRSSGASVWMDSASLSAAETWSAEIVAAIRNCNVFILLLSEHSVSSTNVTKEVALASDNNKSIVAIELDHSELNDAMQYSLAGLHRIAFDDEPSLQRTFEKLGIHLSVQTSADTIAIPTVAETEKKRLAVIPFEDLSPSKDHEWFSDGLAYELIDMLGKVSKIFVIDKQTIRAFKNTKHQSKELARKLQVRYLVFGAVLKSGDRLRIQADLIDAQTGETLWNFRHTGVMEDIFDIQERVAREITDGLKLKLTHEEAKKFEARITDNPEVYALYLRALNLFERQSKLDFQQAVTLYQECIDLDATCAAAYSGLANSLLAIYRHYERDDHILVRAEQAITTALKIDPKRYSTYSMLALLNYYKKNYDEAIALGKKTITLDPESPQAHFHLGFIYMNIGKHLLSAEEFEKVIVLNPADLAAHLNLAIEYDNANEKVKLRVAAERALPIFEQYLQQHPDDHNKRMSLALLLYYCDRKECFDEIEKVLASNEVDGTILYNFAWIYNRHNQSDRALDMLERAVSAGFISTELIRDDPFWAPLHQQQRWKTLIETLEAAPTPHVQTKTPEHSETVVITPLPEGKPKRRLLIAIGIAAIVLMALAYFFFFRNTQQPFSEKPKRIAILPFENLSRNNDDEYFADGMTTELINSLSRIHSLTVTDRVTSMGYRGKKLDVKEIAAQLGVNYIVEGTIRKQDSLIKVTVALIEVETGKTLWTGDFPGSMKDIFETQEKVAHEIIAGLQLTLSETEKNRFNARMTNSPAAYELYLKGFYFRLNETPESSDEAIKYLEQAVSIDPHFIEAIVELGLANFVSVYYHHERANKARELYLRAMAIDSNNTIVLSRYAQLLAQVDHDSLRSIGYAKRAVEIEPTNSGLFFCLGFVYDRFEMWTESVDSYKKSIALLPTNVSSRINLFNIYSERIKDSLALLDLSLQSLPYFKHLLQLHPEHVVYRSFYIRMLAVTHAASETFDQINILVATPNCPSWIRVNAALTAISLQNIPKAEAILEHVIEEGEEQSLRDLLSIPEYQPIRMLPSWQSLKTKIEAKLRSKTS